MPDVDVRVKQLVGEPQAVPPRLNRVASASRLRAVPVLMTLVMLVLASIATRVLWQVYMVAPWTRDGTVRAYVVTVAPEVAGRIVKLPVADNQFVHKGDLLMVIDPANYAITADQAEAAVTQARANADNAWREARRGAQFTNLETSEEEKQTYASGAQAAEAAYQQAVANLARARVDLQRTSIRSPVNGYVTNLRAQLGDYANVGQIKMSLVDADSFWIDGYLEEIDLQAIQQYDPASIRLMGYSGVVQGHVDSIARGINVANAQPDQAGLALVNSIFTWVRLAQRVPVRIHIDQVPDDVRLVQGMTASVEVYRDDEPAQHRANHLRPVQFNAQSELRGGAGVHWPERGRSFPGAVQVPEVSLDGTTFTLNK
jgi:multidrug resistance efflux pump